MLDDDRDGLSGTDTRRTNPSSTMEEMRLTEHFNFQSVHLEFLGAVHFSLPRDIARVQTEGSQAYSIRLS